jgi:hypothetical protein
MTISIITDAAGDELYQENDARMQHAFGFKILKIIFIIFNKQHMRKGNTSTGDVTFKRKQHTDDKKQRVELNIEAKKGERKRKKKTTRNRFVRIRMQESKNQSHFECRGTSRSR